MVVGCAMRRILVLVSEHEYKFLTVGKKDKYDVYIMKSSTGVSKLVYDVTTFHVGPCLNPCLIKNCPSTLVAG